MDRRTWLFWIFVLVLAGGMAGTTLRWQRAVDAYEARLAPATVSGSMDQRASGRIFLDNDAYYWTAYAREMARRHVWRIRHTELDNPPAGRAVHWSQSISWLLLAAGRLRGAATGEPWPVAIENAAIWIGPFLHLLLIAGTGWHVFRRLGLALALVWMANLAALPALQWTFHPLRPDHHGLHLGFMLASGLCLVLGGMGYARNAPDDGGAAWFRPLEWPDRRLARRWAVAAGVWGGLGLWTGASVALFGFALALAGAVAMVWRTSPTPEAGVESDPVFWRVWAWSGAAVALLFYAIEYAPDFPGMRLEVNHPLYAGSWLCAGEGLARWSARRGRALGRRDWPLVPLGLGALLLPALLAFGPPEWHAMRDPPMRRLHETIDEFQPYWAAGGSMGRRLWRDFGLWPVFLAWVPFRIADRRLPRSERTALGMSWLFALGYAGLTAWQARWANFAAAFGVLLGVLGLASLWRERRERGQAAGRLRLLLVLAAGQALLFAGQLKEDIPFRDMSRGQIAELDAPILQRQLAENLGGASAGRPVRVMGSPNLAARLAYGGSVPVVSSYYWENLDGLRATASFFGTENDAEALAIARERGLTHAILPPTFAAARFFHYLQTGVRSEEGAQRSLGGRMLARPEALPDWIRRDVALERALQPGYLLDGWWPVYGTLQVFTVRPGP